MSVNSKMTAIANAIRAKTGKTAPLNLDQMVTEIEGITGGTELFAAIAATYPEGSICTATNGTEVLTAPNTNGSVIFAIPEPETLPETWTVTATDGTNSKSQSVSITTEGQLESVELTYGYYIFQSGKGLADGYSLIAIAYAGGGFYDWNPEVTNSHIKTSEPDSLTWAIAEPVDMQKYKTLKARVLLKTGSEMTLGVTSTKLARHILENIVVSTTISSEAVGIETVISVDISGINETRYIGWNMEYTTNYVYDLWLE